ncbi:MAG: 3-oxoacyl-ACP reductase FabG [Candidatus Competibacteraceae bacterium]|nr:3-oxoacyl-ACP reductase FabG [Candidatus Competibacteraceae bacterium]MBK7982892.1 3-oxoacyl-ACP reductase FabG [Candidatus Competibacteraceae bacterium]MBK8898561.1 3-oxoacyl-ACP reductase FabG [Candidatus Competibacteraceae bacterium]MBK8962365.1 3-oxoacyl-ACP reductase FabG [Candidatus Competibacteraceae bacterium]
MAELEGEIALVTGASRGIGQAIARELGRRGAVVTGTATTDSGAEAIGRDLRECGLKGCGMRLDATDPASVDAVVKAVAQAFGAPGILVNNAAITRDNLLMRMKEEEWTTILDTDLTSVYRLSKAVLRSMMKAQRGRIINITSVVGVTGNPGQTNYAAAKAGIIGFTKSLAREVGSRNITVNAVAPGAIDTDMTRALPQAQRDAVIGTIPLQRLGTAQEVAEAVAFLASPAAAYITGETLHVNGGMYMA